MQLSAKKSIYIVEDDDAVNKVLQRLFLSIGMEVAAYKNATSFLQDIKSHTNTEGCVILDMRLPDISGMDTLYEIKKHYIQLPVIFITGHGDIDLAVRAMKAGAYDFITKPFNNQHLLEQVQRAIQYVSSCDKDPLFPTKINKLTPREREILAYVIEGKSNKEIAYHLSIAHSTVELHRSNIMKKLKLKNLAGLIKYYLINTI